LFREATNGTYLVLKAKDMYELEKIVLKSILSLLQYFLVVISIGRYLFVLKMCLRCYVCTFLSLIELRSSCPESDFLLGLLFPDDDIIGCKRLQSLDEFTTSLASLFI